MVPLSHTALPSSGVFGGRLVRTERLLIARTQPVDTAEPSRQSRNILLAQRAEEGSRATTAQSSAQNCRSPVQDADEGIEGAGGFAEVSERFLRSSLAGSLSGWLGNVNSVGSW